MAPAGFFQLERIYPFLDTQDLGRGLPVAVAQLVQVQHVIPLATDNKGLRRLRRRGPGRPRQRYGGTRSRVTWAGESTCRATSARLPLSQRNRRPGFVLDGRIAAT